MPSRLDTLHLHSTLARMSKIQFWILNGISAVLILLLFTHWSLSRANNRLAAELNVQRALINNARQIQPVLENLVQRIAVSAEKDPKHRALLTKYDIRLNTQEIPKVTKVPTNGPGIGTK